MNIWSILSIHPTNDTKEIKKAYAKQLKLNHPEENPQGYQQLREAYTAALEYSKHPSGDTRVSKALVTDIPSIEAKRKVIMHELSENHNAGQEDIGQSDLNQVDAEDTEIDQSNFNCSDVDDTDPDQTNANQPDSSFFDETFLVHSHLHAFDEFMEKACEIYHNPDTRKDIKCWNELMNMDVVWQLPSRELLTYRMQEFLMEHYLLPKEVWDLLESYFDLIDTDDEILYAFIKQNLYIAVRSGKLKAVKGVLENNVDLEVTDSRGKTAICYAVEQGYYDIVLELLKYNINLEAKDSKGRTVLIDAIISGEYEIAKCLLEYGADCNVADEDGMTALMYVVQADDITVTELLLKHGANVGAKNKVGLSAFYFAVKTENVTILELLRKNGADINQVDEDGVSILTIAVECSPASVAYLVQQGAKLESKSDEMDALYIAIIDNKLEALQYLISGGAPVRTWRRGIMNTLMTAALCGHTDIIKCLLDNGVPVNETVFDEDYGRETTALFYAATYGEEAAVKLLLDCGAQDTCLNIIYSSSAGLLQRVKHLVEVEKADVNEVDERNEATTALIMAIRNNKTEVVKYLMEQGALINVTDKRSSSPLIAAALNSNIEIMELLIEHGADLELKTEEEGLTAFFRCVLESNHASIDYLLEEGANIETQDIQGITPLVGAIINEDINMVQYLIEKGADINALDEYEYSPINYAIETNQLNMVKLLEEKGADINFIDDIGRTYLHLSAVSGHLELVKYFLEKGMSLNDRGNDGNTVLLEAAENDHLNIVEYIITQEKDYDIKAKNRDGKTACKFAAKNLNSEMINLLMNADIELDGDDLREMMEALKSFS